MQSAGKCHVCNQPFDAPPTEACWAEYEREGAEEAQL